MPEIKLREEIRAIKEEFSQDYSASHALKSPAHITLQMPFKRTPDYEPMMTNALREFAVTEKPFTVELDGFGAFTPRVIFIKISNHQHVSGLHSRLRDMMLAQMEFSRDEVMINVHPHITIATRDLSRDSFGRAWPLFENRKFTGAFTVNSLFLMKHNGRSWEILGEFNFTSSASSTF
ncbi:MAG TPA: 2'-5' RNA ligase family protein [Bacteroidales bacterium]|nr:2'-5' RNA ligase family protein [Bacteroidales bacterium]